MLALLALISVMRALCFLEHLLDGGGKRWRGEHLPSRGWRVSAVWRSRVLGLDVSWWTRVGRGRWFLATWQCQWQDCRRLWESLPWRLPDVLDSGDIFCSVCMRWSLWVCYNACTLLFCLNGVRGMRCSQFLVGGIFVFFGHNFLLVWSSLIVGFIGVVWWLQIF
jgi:hypothetical protein